MKEYICHYTSEIGNLTIASDGKNITGLWFDGQKYDRATLPENAAELPRGAEGEYPVIGAARRWLDIYFSGREPDFSVPLAPRGSAFRREVWKILRDIPYGGTTTYGRIAHEMARICGRTSMSPQAVGGAVGHNPISILIPCHRVLGSDGALTGYAGGLDKKRRLLQLEKIPCPSEGFPAPGSAHRQHKPG